MKFGVVLPSFGASAGRLAIVDTALAAERLGYESVWLTDHLALPESDAETFGTIFEAITTMAYLAASTSRVRLGISALVLPQRNPLEVAKQLATVDVLSGGRTMLAAGVGWSPGEYANLGYNFKNRGARMDEAVKILRTCWRGGSIHTFQGKHYRFEKAVLSPTPVQAGGPELWIAGNSPRALRRAITLADGWHPDGMEPQTLEALITKARPLLLNRPFAVVMRTRLNFHTAAGESFLAGTLDEIRQKLMLLRSAGLTGAILSIRASTPARLEKDLQTFASEIMPAFR